MFENIHFLSFFLCDCLICSLSGVLLPIPCQQGKEEEGGGGYYEMPQSRGAEDGAMGEGTNVNESREQSQTGQVGPGVEEGGEGGLYEELEQPRQPREYLEQPREYLELLQEISGVASLPGTLGGEEEEGPGEGEEEEDHQYEPVGGVRREIGGGY